jgi:hypothetical protein
MKAATSYLQVLFDANQDRLAADAILWQGSERNQQAVLDWQESRMTVRDEQVSWPEFRQEALSASTNVLVSMELLAGMPKVRVRRFAAELRPAPLRVIITARDLSRVIPSHWQETTQNCRSTTWKDYVTGVLSANPGAVRPMPMFWQQHHLPTIVDKWSNVATDGVYLVTVPKPGGRSDELWRRFATVLGVCPDPYEQPRFRNRSLGAASAELMRRLNRQVEEMSWPQYRWGFKAALAKQTLADRADREPRPALTAQEHEQVRDRAATMVAELADRDVHVVGDLEELVPAEEPPDQPFDPADVTESDLLAAAEAGLLGLGARVGELQIELKGALRRLDELEAERELSSPTHPQAYPVPRLAQAVNRLRQRLGAP